MFLSGNGALIFIPSALLKNDTIRRCRQGLAGGLGFGQVVPVTRGGWATLGYLLSCAFENPDLVEPCNEWSLSASIAPEL